MKKICSKYFLRIYGRLLSDPVYLFLLIILVIIIPNILFNDNVNSDVINSAVGSFVGAGSAFFLNTFKSKKKKKSNNINVLKRARYIINVISSLNLQLNRYIHDCINNHTDELFEWEKIPEHNNISYIPKIEENDLMFLLDVTNSGEETLNFIFLVGAENKDLIETLEKRNNMYKEYLIKIENRESIPKEKLEEKIGKYLFCRLDQHTKHLKSINIKIIEDCGNAINKINDFLNRY